MIKINNKCNYLVKVVKTLIFKNHINSYKDLKRHKFINVDILKMYLRVFQSFIRSK